MACIHITVVDDMRIELSFHSPSAQVYVKSILTRYGMPKIPINDNGPQ